MYFDSVYPLKAHPKMVPRDPLEMSTWGPLKSRCFLVDPQYKLLLADKVSFWLLIESCPKCDLEVPHKPVLIAAKKIGHRKSKTNSSNTSTIEPNQEWNKDNRGAQMFLALRILGSVHELERAQGHGRALDFVSPPTRQVWGCWMLM